MALKAYDIVELLNVTTVLWSDHLEVIAPQNSGQIKQLNIIEHDVLRDNEDKYDPVKQSIVYLKQKMGSVETMNERK